MITTCHNCKDRHIGCHAVCERYLTARAEQDAINSRLGAERKAERDAEDWKTENIRRLQRRKRGNKYSYR